MAHVCKSLPSHFSQLHLLPTGLPTCSFAPPQLPCMVSARGQPAVPLKPTDRQAVCNAVLVRWLRSQAACTAAAEAGMVVATIVVLWLLHHNAIGAERAQGCQHTCLQSMPICAVSTHKQYLQEVRWGTGALSLHCKAPQACCMNLHNPPAKQGTPAQTVEGWVSRQLCAAVYLP